MSSALPGATFVRPQSGQQASRLQILQHRFHGRRYELDELADTAAALWPGHHNNRFVVVTGGEPALQMDRPLVDALNSHNFAVAIKLTAQLRSTPWDGLDIRMRKGPARSCTITVAEEDHCIPRSGWHHQPGARGGHPPLAFADGWSGAAGTPAAIDYCRSNPEWRLTMQAHKSGISPDGSDRPGWRVSPRNRDLAPCIRGQRMSWVWGDWDHRRALLAFVFGGSAAEVFGDPFGGAALLA